MERKPFSQVTYVTTHQESPHTWKPKTRKPDKIPWIFSMKNENWRLLSRLSTNKICDATIAAASEVGLFRKVTSCSDLYRKKTECTSYPLHGKDRLWSARTCTMDPTTWLIYARRQTRAQAWRKLPGRGTSHNSVHIILE